MANNPIPIRAGLSLTIAGIAGTILLMATAWRIYPGGYDWMNRDLSTMGRIFTVNGLGHHRNFAVYNFALLLWGMSAVVFCAVRAMLTETPGKVWMVLTYGFLIGLGIIGIGITPADAPNGYWHVVSSGIAILSLFSLIFSLNEREEPQKKLWVALTLGCIGAYLLFRFISVPHAGVLFQKFFVLYIFVYMTSQSIVLMKRVPAKRDDFERIARCFGAWILLIGMVVMVGLMLTAIGTFPGGFDWKNHWTSKLGDVFLSDDQTAQGVFPRFMIYNYALAAGGAALTMFWTLRSMRCRTRATGIAMLVVGFVMGCGLAAIGMAPTGALGLHRLGINLFSLAVFAMLLLLLSRNAAPLWSRRVRLFFLLLIPGSVIGFQLLGSDYGKLAQKVLILEIVLWLLLLGFSELRAGCRNMDKEL